MLTRLLRSPAIWGIAAALLVVAPQLRFAHFNTDDFSHLAVLEGIDIHRGMGPWTLYRFIDGDPSRLAERIARGPSPWFADPSAKIDFFRPLSSAAMALNHRLAGLDPLGYALHSLLWYLALLTLLGALQGHVFPRPRGSRPHPAAVLALTIFALCPSNGPTVMWSAARWILISTTLGAAGLVAHLRWREGGWRPGRPLSLLGFVAALLAGEAGLAVLAFVAAYELFARPDALRKRLSALLPVTLLVFVYLVYYKAAGHGSAGLEAYADPLESPGVFLVSLPSKMLAMLGELLLGTPSSRWYFPDERLPTALAGLLALVLLGGLLLPGLRHAPQWTRRRLAWMLAGTLGSLLPLAARMPNPHLLLIPLIGTSTTVAFTFFWWWRRARATARGTRWVGRLAGLVFVFTLLVRPPFAWVAFGQSWERAHTRVATFHAHSVLNELGQDETAVFLNFNDWDLEFHGYYYRLVHGLPMARAWWHLSTSPRPHRYRRTATDTLELTIEGGGVGGRRWQRGDVGELPGLRIVVLDAGREGVSRARFEFESPLSRGAYHFLAWRQGDLREVALPAVGETLRVN